MKKIVMFYFNKTMESLVDNMWRGVWTAVGFIIVMKLTGVILILTS